MVPAGSFASHTPQVEPMRQALLAVLAPLRPGPAVVPFYSTVKAGPINGVDLDPDYWYANLREPVAFDRTVQALLEHGHELFVEMSAHPTLTGAVAENAELADVEVAVVGSLRRDEGGPARVLASVAQAWVHGAAVRWPVAFAGTGARPVALPTYPFQRRRYWLSPPAEPAGSAADPAQDRFWAAVERADLHALAGTLGADGAAALEAAVPALAAWRRSSRLSSTVDSWRYRVTWRPLGESTQATLSGRWLLVVPSPAGAAAAQVAQALAQRGATPVHVAVEPGRADRAFSPRGCGRRPTDNLSRECSACSTSTRPCPPTPRQTWRRCCR